MRQGFGGFMQAGATSFWYLGLLSVISTLSFDLFQPALPAITDDLHTTHALGQLTLSLFVFVLGLSHLIWGPIVDHYGRRRSLFLSLILFCGATVLCIFSSSIQMLIIGRIAQGFSVCCLDNVAYSSTRDYENSSDRARIISHIVTITAISPIFGPFIGSLIFMALGWHAIFAFMIVMALVALLLMKPLLVESPFWQQAEHHFQFGATFRTYKEILSHSQLWIGTIIITSSFTCLMVLVVNAAYLVIDNLHYSPFIFSLLFASNGLVFIAGNNLGIHLREKRSLSWNIFWGSLLMVFGSTLMYALFLDFGFNLPSLSPLLIIVLGVSLISPPALSFALAQYKEQTATATAIINTIRMVFSALIAALASFFIVNDLKLFALSFLICSLICWTASLFIPAKV